MKGTLVLKLCGELRGLGLTKAVEFSIYIDVVFSFVVNYIGVLIEYWKGDEI